MTESASLRAQDAGLAPGAFDLVVNVASSQAHGGFPSAPRELAAYASRIRARRALPGGGETLGFALLTLRR